MIDVIELLDYEEGLRLIPYLCSEGYVTIGYGTLLYKVRGLNPDDCPLRIDEATAKRWLCNDVEKLADRLRAGRCSSTFNKLNTERQTILISMAYQLGYNGLMGFNNMWTALGNGDWEAAKEEALDSLWHRQTPGRAKRHATVLESGSLEVYHLIANA